MLSKFRERLVQFKGKSWNQFKFKNTEITKFRQNHTSLVFRKKKQGKSKNKCGNNIGKGHKLVLMCYTPQAL